MRQGRIMRKAFIVLAGLVIGLAIILILALPNLRARIDPFVQTSDVEEVSFRVKGHGFKIPKAYIWYRPDLRGGEVEMILMHATTEGLHPYSEDLKGVFSMPQAATQVVRFSINQSSRNRFMHDEIVVNDGNACKAVSDGLSLCKEDNYKYIYRIDRAGGATLACEKEILSPFLTSACTAYFRVAPNVVATAHLNDFPVEKTPQFIKELSDLIASFSVERQKK